MRGKRALFQQILFSIASLSAVWAMADESLKLRCGFVPVPTQHIGQLRSDLCLNWKPGLRSVFHTLRGKKLLDLWSYDSKEDFKVLLRDPKRPISTELRNCLLDLLSGAPNCQRKATLPQSTISKFGSDPKNWDPIPLGREASFRFGAREARRMLLETMRAQDQSQGAFEARFIANVKKSGSQSEGSISELPPESKARVLIAIANGYVSTKSEVNTALHNFCENLRKLGFRAEVMPTDTSDDAYSNSRRIADFLNRADLNLDAIILMGVSKGMGEIARAINTPGLLSADTLRKVKVVGSMAGVIRYSLAAKWIVEEGERWQGLLVHSLLDWDLGPNYWAGLVGMSNDNWPRIKSLRSPDELSHITWISLAALPPAETAIPTTLPKLGWLHKTMLKEISPNMGPFDGVVESASSVLPPNTGMTQWIVPMLATHFMMDGTFLDGSEVSKYYRQNAHLKSGVRFTNSAALLQRAILESIPASVLK